VVVIKPCQIQTGGAFRKAKRDTLIAQGCDLHDGVVVQSDKVSRVKLNLDASIGAGGDDVTFNQCHIQFGLLPQLASISLDRDVPVQKANAYNSCTLVILIRFVPVISMDGDQAVAK
jgi:hypothetical protein